MSRPPSSETPVGPNRIGPLRFVLVFGLVSGLGDFVYEGARSIIGPYLATFGASAALVGVITGVGEAVALVFRLLTGRLSDRTGRRRYRCWRPRGLDRRSTTSCAFTGLKATPTKACSSLISRVPLSLP